MKQVKVLGLFSDGKNNRPETGKVIKLEDDVAIWLEKLGKVEIMHEESSKPKAQKQNEDIEK